MKTIDEIAKALAEPLPLEQIDFRVQSINKGGYATILAYKDARADMNRLDEVLGPFGWKRRHCRENHNCVVSIQNPETGEWVEKEDTGTESNTEQEKGLASDSFKRACFNLGIGRELYDFPFISVKLRDNEVDMSGPKPKATYHLKLKKWKWSIERKDGRIIYLCAKEGEATRFEWGSPKTHDEWVTDLADSITAIKDGIAENNLSSAAEAWFELTDQEKQGIWLAPSKGGPFTTEECNVIKSGEFRRAHFGETAA